MNEKSETDTCAEEQWIRRFEQAEQQAQALAMDIAGCLTQAIVQRGSASVAFSGGNTPQRMLQLLADQPLEWGKVNVTLVDERCVDQEHERANARLLKENLFDRLAVMPTFYPLYLPDELADKRGQRLSGYTRPFDVVHLGMGEDGHTASFFPDATNIEAMLDLATHQILAETLSEVSCEQRVSWTLKSLLQSRYTVIQISGQRKWQVMEKVLAQLDEREKSCDQLSLNQSRHQFPILAVLEHAEHYCQQGVSELGIPEQSVPKLSIPMTIYYADE